MLTTMYLYQEQGGSVENKVFFVNENGNFEVVNRSDAVFSFFTTYLMNVVVTAAIRGTNDKEAAKEMGKKLLKEMYDNFDMHYGLSFEELYNYHDKHRVIVPEPVPIILDPQ